MNRFERYLPWGVVMVACLYLAMCARPWHRTYDGFDLDDFATLPVQFNGRVLPLDSVARNALLIVSGRQTFVDEDDQTQPAIRWLLDILVASMQTHAKSWGPMEEYKIFRIENEGVLDVFGLQIRPGLRYSLAELKPKFGVFEARCVEADRKEREKKEDLTDVKLLQLHKHTALFKQLLTQEKIFMLPYSADQKDKPEWASLSEVRGILDLRHEQEIQNVLSVKSVMCYLLMIKACSEKDRQEANLDAKEVIAKRREQLTKTSAEFNKALGDYREWLKEKLPYEYRVARFETFFNRFAPFYQALSMDILVCLLACSTWVALVCSTGLGLPRALSRSALALGIVSFLVHSGALFARMYIMDRPFVMVTNLYSSAVFIGWGCMALGLILEFIFGYGVGCFIGSVCGALSLVIAHHLSLDGDTMNMLVAVLDTNFWLATHVTCVTFGYAATFVTGFIGILYVLANLFVPNIPSWINQIITRMIYGVLCFALMLSFVGTVLGGIWADQSWGRFWGWDPKENGALLIVLMNALTLHARWAGMIKARGLAVMAILGNIMVSWSWFGVNMLSIGLHNYGFMEGVVFWLVAFVVSQLFLAVLGMFDPKQVRAFIGSAAERLGISPIAEDKLEVHS